MKDLHIYSTQQNPSVDDDDDKPKSVEDAHNDGEGSGKQKD